MKAEKLETSTGNGHKENNHEGEWRRKEQDRRNEKRKGEQEKTNHAAKKSFGHPDDNSTKCPTAKARSMPKSSWRHVNHLF